MKKQNILSIKMNYVNLGCGERFINGWINIDFNSKDKGVITHDLRKSIPLEDDSADVVYHSHVLEHFSKDEAPKFMKECFRILKRNGVVRIAVPDLEGIAKNYLKSLNSITSDSGKAWNNYEWMMLELYDQAVRNTSGGEMIKYFQRDVLPNKSFVIKRCGVEVKKLIEAGREKYIQNHSRISEDNGGWNILGRIRKMFVEKRTYEYLMKRILKNEYAALQIGRFRMSGEIHQWMYDRKSLARLLAECGFSNIIRKRANESIIPDWSKFNLDTEPDGSIYKPDSIYMEAVKP